MGTCQHLYKSNLHTSTSCCWKGWDSLWEVILHFFALSLRTKKSQKCTLQLDLEISVYEHFDYTMTRGSWLRGRKICFMFCNEQIW